MATICLGRWWALVWSTVERRNKALLPHANCSTPTWANIFWVHGFASKFLCSWNLDSSKNTATNRYPETAVTPEKAIRCALASPCKDLSETFTGFQSLNFLHILQRSCMVCEWKVPVTKSHHFARNQDNLPQLSLMLSTKGLAQSTTNRLCSDYLAFCLFYFLPVKKTQTGDISQWYFCNSIFRIFSYIFVRRHTADARAHTISAFWGLISAVQTPEQTHGKASFIPRAWVANTCRTNVEPFPHQSAQTTSKGDKLCTKARKHGSSTWECSKFRQPNRLSRKPI